MKQQSDSNRGKTNISILPVQIFPNENKEIEMKTSKVQNEYRPMISNAEDKVQLVKSKKTFIGQQRGVMRANTSKFEEMINLVKKHNDEDIKKESWRTKLAAFLDNNYLLAFMTLLTIFSLFSSDVQAAWCPPTVDYSFNVVQTMLLAFFSIEIILCCISKDNYFLSFFFWLDVLATLSLIQDIDWIFNALLALGLKYNLLFKISVLMPPLIPQHNPIMYRKPRPVLLLQFLKCHPLLGNL